MSQNLTPVLADKKMSDSLRERLKRTSRYYSPQTSKQQCSLRERDRKETESDKNEHSPGKDGFRDSSPDFEYSDEEHRISTPASAQRITNKESMNQLINPTPELDQSAPMSWSKSSTKRKVPKEKLAVPKFKGKRAKTSVDTLETINNSDDNSIETNCKVAEISKSAQKAQVPKFERTSVKLKSVSCKDFTANDSNGTELAHDSTAEMDPQATIGTDKSEKDEEISIDNYKEEKTKTYATEELDNMTFAGLNTVKKDVQQQLEQKKETLRKLKIVKMYRSKNNLVELEQLISKWRGVSHEALEQLLHLLPEQQRITSVYQLARYFNLDLKLLCIQPDESSQDQG